MREIVAFTQQQCRAEHTFFQPFFCLSIRSREEKPLSGLINIRSSWTGFTILLAKPLRERTWFAQGALYRPPTGYHRGRAKMNAGRGRLLSYFYLRGCCCRLQISRSICVMDVGGGGKGTDKLLAKAQDRFGLTTEAPTKDGKEPSSLSCGTVAG